MNVHAGTIEVRDQPEALGTEPIPSKFYYDPEWYELERKAVWMRSWLNVGHVCELPEPGSFIRRELEFAKASILIVRGKDGEIRRLPQRLHPPRHPAYRRGLRQEEHVLLPLSHVDFRHRRRPDLRARTSSGSTPPRKRSRSSRWRSMSAPD